MNSQPVRVPEQPATHRVYGSLIYWVAMAASVLCIVGPFLAVASPGRNLLDPHYLFYAIWQGQSPQQLWAQTRGGFPGAHFWLRHLGNADAIVQLGIVLGCSSAGLAFVATAFAYLRKDNREVGWAVLVLINATIILCAALGLIQLG